MSIVITDTVLFEEGFDEIPIESVKIIFGDDLMQWLHARTYLITVFEMMYAYSTPTPFFLPFLKQNFMDLCKYAPTLVCAISKVVYVKEEYRLNDNFLDDNYIVDTYFLNEKNDANKIITTAENSFHACNLKLVANINSSKIVHSTLIEMINIINDIIKIRYYKQTRTLYYLLLNELKFSIILLKNIDSLNKASDFVSEYLIEYKEILNQMNTINYNSMSESRIVNPFQSEPRYPIIDSIHEDLILIYNRIEIEIHELKKRENQTKLKSKVTKQNSSSNPVTILDHFNDLTWEKIQIVFTSNDSVTIRSAKYHKEYHFSDLQMNDNRRCEKPDRNWALLKKFAEENGTIHYDSILYEDNKKKLKKSTSNLRKKLKQLFGIEENPIENYKSRMGYKTKFDIKSEIPEQFYGSDQQKEKINELKGE